MIRNVRIENFKSVQSLEMELGRVNVFIGENGCGKSNILEAIGFSAASSQDKLGNEYLAPRGIRVTDPRFMFASFGEAEDDPIKIRVTHADGGVTDNEIDFEFSDSMMVEWFDDSFFSERRRDAAIGAFRRVLQGLKAGSESYELVFEQLRKFEATSPDKRFDFYIFSPENSALRTFQAEGQILPLGIRGEGLFAYLKALNSSSHRTIVTEIAHRLSLIDWFERFEIPHDLAPFENSIAIRDRYLAEGALFDQRSANEGFLFLLFYFTLFISPATPKIFAIDNIDASLNPKLCAELTKQLVELAAKHDKQVILTTHNPAVLDGLDLQDDEQRLFVISRNQHGHTKARRMGPPKPLGEDPPLKLSEAFLRGYLGGLPKNF